MQYLIKWKGYPASENSWLLEKELAHAKELLDKFKRRTHIPVLQVQQNPKEGILSWTESTTSSFQSSKSKVPQVNPVIRPTRDPEKQGTCDKLSGDLIPRDQNRSKSPDISCALTCDKSRDQIRFGRARSPLINKWQTMGTVCNQRRHMTPVVR